MSAQVNGLTVRQQHRAEQAAAKPLDSKIRCLFCPLSVFPPLIQTAQFLLFLRFFTGGRAFNTVTGRKAAALTHRGGPIILSCAALTNDERIHDDVDTCHRGSRQSAQRQRRAPSELRLHAREKSPAGARTLSSPLDFNPSN